MIVDKLDLIGLEEIWALCLNIRDLDIAQKAISFLLENIYINLAPKFKKVSWTLIELKIAFLSTYTESLAWHCSPCSCFPAGGQLTLANFLKVG